MSSKHIHPWGILACVVALWMPAMGHTESLYKEGQFRPLTADQKAFKQGDIVTIQIFERSSAQASSDTDTRRDNQVGAQFKPLSSGGKNLGVTTQGEFQGGGSTQRSNRLLATITVTVKECLPGGDLNVQGEQTLTINGEQQRVALQGRLRPQDINEQNVALSSRLAEAQITFVGEGDLTERQRRPAWRRLLDALGL